MTRAMNRSISFWILLAASVALTTTGAVVALDHLGTMTATLKNGSATGLEVYAGQSWIVIGAALLGAGVLGLLISLALAVVSSIVGAASTPLAALAPRPAEETDDAGDPEGALDAPAAADELAPAESDENARAADEAGDADEEETQNGSSGSTATATKISVR
ncbi:hypothetical protein [Microbacterium sp. USTB-Y]|uniref:hypothetical protein n=1 Tax=Microbacterium sp. USTB-Y TaxID=2823692 RepID=UPI00203CAA90|nr:hypothetical protein [Microbacterium sp. USTB-Y]